MRRTIWLSIEISVVGYSCYPKTIALVVTSLGSLHVPSASQARLGRIVEDVDVSIVDVCAEGCTREVNRRWVTQSRSVIGQTKKTIQQHLV